MWIGLIFVMQCCIKFKSMPFCSQNRLWKTVRQIFEIWLVDKVIHEKKSCKKLYFPLCFIAKLDLLFIILEDFSYKIETFF